MIGRSLTGQIDEFLRRHGDSRAATSPDPVPTYGNDEFAQLGSEFNSMSGNSRAR